MSQFTKPIQEAVAAWARTFDPKDLCAKIEKTFHDEVDRQVKVRTAELHGEAQKAQAEARADRAVVDGLQRQIAKLQQEKAEDTRMMSAKYAALKGKYDDLETRQNAVIRSSQVAV